MYKILKNITWCGKTFTEGMFYGCPEATRQAQLDALVAKGLIEKAPEPEKTDFIAPSDGISDEKPKQVRPQSKSSKRKGHR